MPSKDLIILDKLIGYSEDISDYVLDMDKEKFVADSKTMAACAFSLGQIGELSKKVSTEFRDKYNHIPWHKIYGLRNRLFHDYDGVNNSYFALQKHQCF